MTQPPALRRGGIILHGHHLQFKLREERDNYLNPWNQSLWTPRQWITMLHWGMEQGFIYLEFGGFCVLSEQVIVMRKSKLMNTRTLSQFCGALIGCLILKLESQQQEGEEPHYHGQVGCCRTGVIEIRGRERGVDPQSVSLVHLQNKKSKWDLFYHLIILSMFGSVFYRYHITDRYSTRWIHL